MEQKRPTITLGKVSKEAYYGAKEAYNYAKEAYYGAKEAYNYSWHTCRSRISRAEVARLAHGAC